MIGMTMQQVKAGFFDRPAVTKSVDRARLRVLRRAGAFVRTRARSSIRKRKRISEPGSPPSSHTGLLKRGILFAYDPSNRSVVVGPMLLNRRVQPAPELLEQRGNASGRLTDHRRGKRLVYRARPFMRPAMVAERDNIAKSWRNSVR